MFVDGCVVTSDYQGVQGFSDPPDVSRPWLSDSVCEHGHPHAGKVKYPLGPTGIKIPTGSHQTVHPTERSCVERTTDGGSVTEFQLSN